MFMAESRLFITSAYSGPVCFSKRMRAFHILTIVSTWLILVLRAPLLGAAGADVSAVPTFESLGLYYNAPENGPCQVWYRANGVGEWREGHPLVYDRGEKQYRGSLRSLRWKNENEILPPGKGNDVGVRGGTQKEEI